MTRDQDEERDRIAHDAGLLPDSHVLDVEIVIDTATVTPGCAPRDGQVRRRAAGALAGAGVGYPRVGERRPPRGGATAGGGAAPPCTGSSFLETLVQFETAMNGLRAVTAAGPQQLALLRAQSKVMALRQTSTRSAAELIDLVTQLAKHGVPVSTAGNVLNCLADEGLL